MGSFEDIVGKSIAEEGPSRRFGFVHDYDTKPKRRLYETLISQGMQKNQQMVFLSDGGDTVRDLQSYLNPCTEHLLDWFHITMRLTVLGQLVKGIRVNAEAKGTKKGKKRKKEEESGWPSPDELDKQLERAVVTGQILHLHYYSTISPYSLSDQLTFQHLHAHSTQH